MLSLQAALVTSALLSLLVSSHKTPVHNLKIPSSPPLGPCKCPDGACVIGFQNSQAVLSPQTVSPPMQELWASRTIYSIKAYLTVSDSPRDLIVGRRRA